MRVVDLDGGALHHAKRAPSALHPSSTSPPCTARHSLPAASAEAHPPGVGEETGAGLCHGAELRLRGKGNPTTADPPCVGRRGLNSVKEGASSSPLAIGGWSWSAPPLQARSASLSERRRQRGRGGGVGVGMAMGPNPRRGFPPLRDINGAILVPAGSLMGIFHPC